MLLFRVPADLSLDSLLAEPAPRDPQWLGRCYVRLRAAARAPVALGAEGPARERLEAAGWPVLPPGADDGACRVAASVAWPHAEALSEGGEDAGVGSPAPRLVLVGERSPKGAPPFLARSGTWLLRALRELGHDELTVRLTNALDPLGRSRSDRLEADAALLGPAVRWVALGRDAAATLAGAGIEHAAVLHPAAHKRYRYAEDVAGYAALLEAAGVPPGPWRGRELPSVSAPADLSDVPEGLRPPASVAFRRSQASGSGTRARGKGVAEARLAFILGRAQSPTEAARLAGADVRTVTEAARAGDWDAERVAHEREVLDRAKARSADRIAEARAASASAAWAATAMATAKVAQAIEDGKLEPSAADALRLARLALELTDEGRRAVPALLVADLRQLEDRYRPVIEARVVGR